MKYHLFVTAAAFGMTALSANAQSSGEWIYGLGGIHKKTPYVGAKNNEVDLVPFLSYSNDVFELGVQGFSMNVLDRGNFSLDVEATPWWKPDMPDTALFDGLKRDTTLGAGFSAAYTLDAFYGEVSASHDVLSKHDGYRATAKIGTTFQAAGFDVDLGIGTRYSDKKLNAYLYGVSASEANASRAAYDPGSDWTPFVDVSVSYAITDDMAVVGFAGYEDLSKSATNSPLVGKDHTAEFGVLLLRKF